MVLTKFECWAHGGSDDLSVGGLIERRAPSVDLFNPTAALQQTCTVNGEGGELKNVSHLSSNGYYGFVSCNVNSSGAGTYILKSTDGDSGNDNGDVRCSGQHTASETESGSTTICKTHSVAGVYDDSMMDVEQHQTVASVGSRRDAAGAMFLQYVPTLPEAIATVAGGIRNGFDRRKRIFVAEDADLMGMEAEMVKRLRYDSGDHWIDACNDKNISLSYFAVQNDTHSAMDHDDIPVATPFVEKQTENIVAHIS